MVFILSVWPNFVFGFYIELLIKFRLWFSMLSYRWNSGYRYWSNSLYGFFELSMGIPYMVFIYQAIDRIPYFLLTYWATGIDRIDTFWYWASDQITNFFDMLVHTVLSYSIDRIPEIFYIELLIEFLSWFLYWALPPTTVSTPRLASRAPHLCEKNNSSTSATKNPPPPPRTGFWGHQQ